jgi:Ca2+-binding EF-hand superfamily protein
MSAATKWALAAAGLILTAGTASTALGGEERESRGDAMWQRLDSDADGRISRAEADAAKGGRLAENFATLDSNQDGFLTREELQAAKADKRAHAKERMQQQWREADVNGDGQLSLDEAQAKMPRVAERFNTLDADKNGLLSPEEMRGMRHRRQ